MTDTPIIVIGMDGLDSKKVDRWIPEIKQSVSGTMSLEEFEEPYFTNEIWPSMILGRSPREYGWDPKREGVTRESSADWETPGVNAASNIAEKFVPHSIRKRIGAILKENIEDPAPKLELDKVNDHLFTGLKSKAIEIPNWNRGELDLALTRESWKYVVEEDGGIEKFYNACESEIETITNETKSAMDYPYDVIFNHYHFLDLVQHYFDEEVQKEWYERTADIINEFVDNYPNITIVIMSDHGLSDGVHRPPAFVTVANPWTKDLPKNPMKVRPWLEDALVEDIESNEEITKHMRDLGYL